MTIPAPSSSPPSSDNPADRLSLLLRVGVFVLIGWLGTELFPMLMAPFGDLIVTSALSTFAAAAVANAITVRIYEHGRLSDIGLGTNGRSLREFFTGAGVAAGAATVMLVVPVTLSIASFERVPVNGNPWVNLAFIGVVLLFGAAGEEMLFHGYAFQLLVRSIGAFAAILPVGVLFGLVHLSNQNATILAAVNTAGWGILLGYAYVRTGALWLPIGMHFGWNLSLSLFGVNLSGFTMGVTGYGLLWRTGDLWSGGAYGPEGGLLTTFVVVGLFFVLPRITPEEVA